MAFKTLVENPSPLIEQLEWFLQRMNEKGRGFSLAMLVPSEASGSDKWNLVLSAPWIDDNGGSAVIPDITSELLRHLSKTNAKKLERVSVLSTRDPLVSRMVDFRIPLGKPHLVQQYPFIGGSGEAIVLVAEPIGSMTGHYRHAVQTRA